MVFVVSEERDDIFIATPKTYEAKREKIFLTRVNGCWVGDCRDKKLMLKIGREIEAAVMDLSGQSRAV
jgi:hypothetical protein